MAGLAAFAAAIAGTAIALLGAFLYGVPFFYAVADGFRSTSEIGWKVVPFLLMFPAAAFSVAMGAWNLALSVRWHAFFRTGWKSYLRNSLMASAAVGSVLALSKATHHLHL